MYEQAYKSDIPQKDLFLFYNYLSFVCFSKGNINNAITLSMLTSAIAFIATYENGLVYRTLLNLFVSFNSLIYDWDYIIFKTNVSISYQIFKLIISLYFPILIIFLLQIKSPLTLISNYELGLVKQKLKNEYNL